MAYKQFFPLTRIPKDQQKGSKGNSHSESIIHISGKAITMAEPFYTTEKQITSAIATGTFKGSSSEAYRLAAEWQKQVKASEPKTFRKPAPKPQANGKYNHTMQFGGSK